MSKKQSNEKHDGQNIKIKAEEAVESDTKKTGEQGNENKGML